MDTHLHVREKVEEALSGTRSGDSLLNVLTETVLELEAVRRGNHRTLGPAEEDKESEEQVERECKKSTLRALRELSVFLSERVAVWREACKPGMSPPEGSDQQQSSTAEPESESTPCPDSFSDTLKSIGGDVQIILEKLSTILMKLDTEIGHLSAAEASTVNAVHQETSGQSEDGNSRPNACDYPRSYSTVEDGGDGSQMREQTPVRNDVEESGKEIEVVCRVDYKEECVSVVSPEKTEKDAARVKSRDGKETKREWTTVGLAGEAEDSRSHVPDACFIRAAAGAAGVLRCEAADALSCLMVSGSEELVSRVVRVGVRAGADPLFPVSVALPFRTRHRSSYRDVAVKVVDGAGRGTFAEVRVYSLGVFAVISRLRRENYTVPSRGLSLKLSVDPRISLSYPPGSFTASVMALITVQPVDATLLGTVQSRSEACHPVVSTSPLLYLTHPITQPLRRPLSVTLPCPPNPARKRHPGVQREGNEHHHDSVVRSGSHAAKILKASDEMSREQLVALGWKDKQWELLEHVSVRNQQNGLVSLELTENLDRLLVVRLLAPLQPRHLTSLAEELEEAALSHAVTIVLQRREAEPHAVLVAALPSRDLHWELNHLRAQGYGDLLQTSSEISLREGDQLLLRFSGNITSTGSASTETVEHITFHTQRRNHLSVHLCEVDPFGNHSSPHYKGTLVFHRVSRGQPARPGDPVCKLPLTLPKRVRSIDRPVTAKIKLCEETDPSDSVLLWLSGELSEEDVASLVLSLRLHRSAAQLVKLRAGADPCAQALHVLSMWRRGLPAAPHHPKASQLAQGLAKSGRPDLAKELLLRQAAATRLKQEAVNTYE